MPSKIYSKLNRNVILIIIALLFLTSTSIYALELSPDTLQTCFPLPNLNSAMKFRVRNASIGTKLTYRISDINDSLVVKSQASISTENILKVHVKLDIGYYKISFPDSGQTFGIVCLPNIAKIDKDDFFCIDAGLSWSGMSMAQKKEIVEVLRKKGIAMFRERFSWNALSKDKGLSGLDKRYPAYSQLRNMYKNQKIKILELFHTAPAYTRPSPFPRELIAVYKAWRQIAGQWKGAWGALELWNEPNNFGVPGDQYVAMAKAVTYALRRESSRTVVVGGCYNPSVSLDFLNNCADNGLLQVVDAISFHIYSSPGSVIEYVDLYRKWLEKYNKKSMPLWISESGSPVTVPRTKKLSRLSSEQDLKTARNTVMRGIIARACGVAKYFPFYLQPHQEGDVAWGMTDSKYTPLLSMAGWLQATRALSGKSYLGSLSGIVSETAKVFVFGDADDAVIVCYSPKTTAIKLNIPTKQVQDIDGRILQTDQNALNIPNSIIYAWVSPEAVKNRLLSNDQVMQLYKISKLESPVTVERGVILQADINKTSTAQISEIGYFLTSNQANNLKIALYVNNLTKENKKVNLEILLPINVKIIKGTKSLKLNVPGQKKIKTLWNLDMADLIRRDRKFDLKILAKNPAGEIIDELVIPFHSLPSRTFYNVFHCRGKVNIDGYRGLNEWNNASCISNFETFSENRPGRPVELTANDLSASACFQWDDDGLYYLVEVNDQKHLQEESMGTAWKQDSLQLAFYKENSSINCDRFEWGFALGKKEPESTAYITSSGEQLKSSKYVTRRDEAKKQTIYEGKLAWSDLGSMKAVVNKNKFRFRFNLAVNDSDGKERKWLEWTPGIAQSKTTDNFIEFILSPESQSLLEDNFSDGDITVNPSWKIKKDSKEWSIVDHKGDKFLQVIEGQGEKISLRIPETNLGSILQVSLLLKNTTLVNTGYNFRLSLYDSSQNAGYSVWCAPSLMFAEKSGFVVANYTTQTPIAVGTTGKRLFANLKLQKIIITYDPAAGSLTVSHGLSNGKQQIVAHYSGKHKVQKLDTFEMSTSNWGASPLLIDKISITGIPK